MNDDIDGDEAMKNLDDLTGRLRAKRDDERLSSVRFALG